jgi:hypothetical protein
MSSTISPVAGATSFPIQQTNGNNNNGEEAANKMTTAIEVDLHKKMTIASPTTTTNGDSRTSVTTTTTTNGCANGCVQPPVNDRTNGKPSENVGFIE